jgi:hypothetical protein
MVEHGLRRGLSSERRGQVGRHLNAGLSGVGGFLAAVYLGPRHLGEARDMHPALGNQSFNDAHVASRPHAARPAWSKTLLVGVLVTAPETTINPAIAERFVECLVVCKASY